MGAESGQKDHLRHQVCGLISQWDCIVQRDGLLFCQLLHPDIEEKIRQLLLPECLKLHQNHEQQGVEWTKGEVLTIASVGTIKSRMCGAQSFVR